MENPDQIERARTEALRLAVGVSHHSSGDASQIVSDAKKFENFLRGRTDGNNEASSG